MTVCLFAVLQLEIVPVLDAAEETELTVVQFQFRGALDDVGKHIAFFKVQVAVVRQDGFTGSAITLTDQGGIGIFSAPADAVGNGVVPTAVEAAPLELDGVDG